MSLKTFIISTFILIYSCANYNTQPQWIENSTSNQDYWVGIGIVTKPHNGNLREAAWNDAISEIASQIRVDISSTMERVVKQTNHNFKNYNFEDYTKSIVKSRIENNLPHVEFIKSHEDEHRYYVLAKLSKKKYYDELMNQKKNAINLAVNYIEKSDKLFSIQSIHLLQEALNEIIQYSQEPIIVNYPKASNKSENLYSLIKTKIVDNINKIKISSDTNQLNIRSGWVDLDNKIIIRCKNKETDEILPNVPILITTQTNEYIGRVITNKEGFAQYVISPDYSNNYTYTIELKLDVETMGIDYAFSKLIKDQIIVNHIPLKIHIKSVEKNLDIPLELDLAEPSIREYLSKNIFVEFTSEKDADLVIQFSVNTSKKNDNPNEWGIYQTFGSGTLNVYDPKANVELFSTTSGNVYGADYNSNTEAGINCIEEIINKLIKEDAKNMIEILAGLREK